MKHLQFLVGVVAFLITSVAFAENPCKGDVKKLCPNIKDYSFSTVRDCVKDHQNELSEGCKNYVNKAKSIGADFKNACGGDISQICAGKNPLNGELKTCLMEHKDSVSGKCKGALQDAREKLR